uniref:Uncharacterized protein n=1 Tax=Arundo donax TaxID=35708 RepID=A0A0A9C4N1_ARUDO
MCLKLYNVSEALFPGLEGRPGALEDKGIPLFPNFPGRSSKDFHEESMGAFILSIVNHLKEAEIAIPSDPHMLPASFTEWAFKE